MVPLPFGSFSDPETGRVRIRLVNPRSSSYRVAREYMIRLPARTSRIRRSSDRSQRPQGSRPRPSAAGTAISPRAEPGPPSPGPAE
jgi:hypothetical protein